MIIDLEIRVQRRNSVITLWIPLRLRQRRGRGAKQPISKQQLRLIFVGDRS
jgi:hypothetical protein